MNICADILQNIENDPDFSGNVKLVMNHGVFSMTQKLSANPCIGTVPLHQGKKKAQMMSHLKAIIVIFDIREVVHIDLAPEGQTVNQVCYKEVLTTLHERVRRKKPEMCKNGSSILHHDNAPAHNALSVRTFLVKHKIPVLEHPPCSPDIAP
jgi:hypothetical protein